MESLNKKMQEVEQYLLAEIKKFTGDGNIFTKNTNLLETRILSSIALINLIVGLEELIDIEIVNDNVDIKDFSTVNNIMHMVSETLKNNYDR